MKIFIGLLNVASLIKDYAAGFRALGHEVFSVAENTPDIVDSDVDMNISAMIRARFAEAEMTDERVVEMRRNLMDLAWRKALEADVCLFIWKTFREDGSDLAELRRRGKKIIVRFCGSDVREPEVEAQAGRMSGAPCTRYLKESPTLLERRLRHLRMSERYADLLIGLPRMGLRPIMAAGGWLHAPEAILPHPPQRPVPVILHAPSKTFTKGSHHILAALDALREAKLPFGSKLIQGIPHDAMPAEYASADIFCNSVEYGGRSVFEAMNAGCVVADRGIGHAVRMFSEFAAHSMRCQGFRGGADELGARWLEHNRVPEFAAMPIEIIGAEDVARKLFDLVTDLPRRTALAAMGPAYVERVLRPERRCQEILDYLAAPESESSRMRLFAYPFFNRHFVPSPDPVRLKLYNRYTALVRDCDWYRQCVRPGERDGLVF